MSGDKVPPITVKQKLFVDRWWSNGGNVIEAVEYAGYEGYAYPSDRAAKGRRVLAGKAVRKYVDFLKVKAKADRKAAAQEAALATERAKQQVAKESSRAARDLKSRPVESGVQDAADLALLGGDAAPSSADVCQENPDVICQEKPDRGVVGIDEDPMWGVGSTSRPWPAGDDSEPFETLLVGGSTSGAMAPCDVSNGTENGIETGLVSWPERPRSLTPTDLGSHVAGTMLPPHQIIPARDCNSAELTPPEVRRILANIARGNEQGMRDARSRLRAIELAMRNMGMLVDVSLTATTTTQQQAGPDVRTMSPDQRAAEMAKLESYFTSIKEAANQTVKASPEPAAEPAPSSLE